MTVNESGTTLNTTLAISDIKLHSHGPHAAKCSVSWPNPEVTGHLSPQDVTNSPKKNIHLLESKFNGYQ